jgi:glycosyltransferase involved in cell wall biosynthesis
MKTLWYIPIEPLEERYSKQWYTLLPREFKKAGFKVNIIDGEPLTDKIETGEFLDINSTLHYKAEQLKKIAQLFYADLIKPNDIFFIADLEFWGIESIKYLSVLNKVPVKIYAFLHAASYYPGDFMQPCEPFAKFFEKGWLEVCDKIFVGSEYHKKLVIDTRGGLYSDSLYKKIIVTGNPWSTKDALAMVGKVKKKNQIVYSDQPDYRKRPNIFLSLVPVIKQLLPQTEIIVTTSRESWGGKTWLGKIARSLQDLKLLTIKEGLSKKEYYTILAESKAMVSTNVVAETFGYCAVEAMTFNACPFLPNMFSYPELYGDYDSNLYDDFDELLNKLRWHMKISPHVNTLKYAERYDKSIQQMIEEMI